MQLERGSGRSGGGHFARGAGLCSFCIHQSSLFGSIKVVGSSHHITLFFKLNKSPCFTVASLCLNVFLCQQEDTAALLPISIADVELRPWARSAKQTSCSAAAMPEQPAKHDLASALWYSPGLNPYESPRCDEGNDGCDIGGAQSSSDSAAETSSFACESAASAVAGRTCELATAAPVLHPGGQTDTAREAPEDQDRTSSRICNSSIETRAAEPDASSASLLDNQRKPQVDWRMCMRFSPRVSRTSGFFLAKIIKKPLEKPE